MREIWIYRETIRRHLEKPIFRIISEAADELQVACYLIGGAVRDFFLYRPSTDMDVVAVGSGIELAERVALKMGEERGKRIPVQVFKTFGTAQLKHGGYEIEFVGARKESYRHDSRKPVVEDGTLEEDQERRDFTINAMAFCLNRERYGELLDPFNGLQDLQDLIIRTPREPGITFSDDPLRMMRAVRFASQLGFDIHPDTFDAIRDNRERIEIVSMERVTDELNKIILSPKPSVGFILLEKTGLLEIIFPELCELKGAERKMGWAQG